MPEGIPKGGLVEDGLGPRIDRLVAEFLLIGPKTDQPPAQRHDLALAVPILPAHQHPLDQCHIVAGLQVSGGHVIGEPVQLDQLAPRGVSREASAHGGKTAMRTAREQSLLRQKEAVRRPVR